MAGQKSRITFFKRDIDMTNDSRMRKVLRRFGGLAVSVYEEVLAMVYETGSYFIVWMDDYALDIADRLYEPDQEKIQQIIGMLIEVGLFSNELFEKHRIITSHGIQERFTERGDSSHRRREIQQYALIKEDDTRECAELRETARDCAEMRDNSQNGAETRSRVRVRVRDRERAISKDKALAIGCVNSLSVDTERERAQQTQKKPPELPNQENLQSEPPRFAPNARSENIHKDNQFSVSDDSEGILCDSEGNPSENEPPEDENDPVTQVVRVWNEIFKGTPQEYKDFYPSPMLSHRIMKRWAREKNLSEYRKVFTVAREEARGEFPWTLFGVFNKEETFQLLQAKSAMKKQRGAPALTSADYDSDGWEN